jgi:uncharacterized damage-inducible protein DinB
MAKQSLDLHHYLEYILDEAAFQKAWHGTNFLGSLRNVSAKEALKRPEKGRHNIWELAVHSAYWKYRIIQKLKKDRTFKFPLAGSNFFASPAKLTDKEWKETKSLAKKMHDKLKAALKNIESKNLETKKGKYKVWELIVAIALHDVYHTGQIQLVKRLIRNSK